MRGVSEVIAIILILMITISLAGLAYMFMSTTMSDVTSSAGSTVDTTTSSMLTSFIIESMDIAKVYVRNTGQNSLTSLSVYVNDEPAVYNVTTPIAAGAVGTVTIYSFIPDGATVKVTSPNGFSTSKVAHPCEKAVGCWDFDEGAGTVVYDSSPYGNTGTLVNGPVWTSGKYGGAITFDGTNDYINITGSSVKSGKDITVSFWVNPKTFGTDSYGNQIIMLMDNCITNGYGISFRPSGYINVISGVNGTSSGEWHFQPGISTNTWYNFVFIWKSLGTSTSIQSIYINGQPTTRNLVVGVPGRISSNMIIGYYYNCWYERYFNGTIDEVRIYDRAIY